MPAQLFPLFNRAQQDFENRQSQGQLALQQQEAQRDSAFRQQALAMQQQSAAIQNALGQQQLANEHNLAPIRQQLLQQELGTNSLAAQTSMQALQQARDMAPYQQAQAQANLQATGIHSLSDVMDQALMGGKYQLSQKLGQSELDQDAARLNQEHSANMTTIALMPPALRAVALKPYLDSGQVDQQTAQAILGAPSAPKDLNNFAQDIGNKLTPQAQVSFLINLDRAKQQVSPEDQLKAKILNVPTNADDGLAKVNAIMAQYAAARSNQVKSSTDFSTAPTVPLGQDGKVDPTQLKAGAVYNTPNNGPLLYTGQPGQSAFVDPSRMQEFFPTSPTGTQAFSGNGSTQTPIQQRTAPDDPDLP